MTENKSTIQTVAGVPERERAVLVAVVRDSQELRQSEEYLDELEFLAETADITTVRRFSQRLPQPSSRIYVGPGKLEEIAAYCEEHAVDVAIFDDELTPAQTRNIERAMPCRILDRTRLILDIFLARAQTAYAKTQVQLAQYEYMLPRLAGLWTHLERQRGGTGTRGGAGEREIETDRRIVRNRISKLKEDLKKIDRQMAVQRSNRGQLVRVALVGYTNVGKSTLMNLIAKSEVFAENKLFATLDTTVRKVVFDNLPFLLSDTVGFIRKLPIGADRIVQIDTRRGARSRSAAARGGYFAPPVRGSDRRGEADLAGDRRGRQTGLPGFQQDRRLYVDGEGRRRPDARHGRKPFARRPETELDRQGQHPLHLPLGQTSGPTSTNSGRISTAWCARSTPDAIPSTTSSTDPEIRNTPAIMEINILNRQNTVLNKFIAEIRDRRIQCDSMRFRRNLERIGELMAYEISKRFRYTPRTVETPLGEAEVELYDNEIVIATILRAGLPFHQGFLNYFDDAQNAFVSAYRKSKKDGTFTVKVEYISCGSLEGKTMLLVDPMLATGSSAALVYEALVEKGGMPAHTHVASIIGSEQGVDYVQRHMPHATTSLWCAAVDEELTSRSYIVPGIGDAGDLAYGEKL